MKKLLILVLCLSVTMGCFVASPLLSDASGRELGDVNNDGYVDNLDAVRILMYDAGIIDFAEAELSVTDINSDGYVDNLDATLILLYDAGINDTVTGKDPETSDADSSEHESSEESSEIACAHDDVTIINRVDATIDFDGYSGDEYCLRCEQVVRQGVVLEKFTNVQIPVTYITYSNSNGASLTLPKGVDVLEYTLKRANKYAVSEYPEIEAEILRLINIEREKAGVAPLKNQPGAYYFSNLRAKECAELFEHTRPNGEGCFSVFADEEVFYRTAGENIFSCRGYSLNSIAALSVTSWMNSEGHRNNILNPNFTSSTIGVFYDPYTYEFYAAHLFMA